MAITKRARTSAGRQMATFRRSATMSARYNRAMSSRLQRAPGMSGETGYVDLAVATYAMDTTGTVTLLGTISQGAAVTQRVGKRIVWKSVQCRGNIINSSTATTNDVAYMIVYDKRPTGSLPTITDILVSASTFSMNNDNNSGRFSILKRVDEQLVGPSTGLNPFCAKIADFYLKIKDLPCVYKSAATGGIGDIEQGALYLVTVGEVAAGTAAASGRFAFRVRFRDI